MSDSGLSEHIRGIILALHGIPAPGGSKACTDDWTPKNPSKQSTLTYLNSESTTQRLVSEAQAELQLDPDDVESLDLPRERSPVPGRRVAVDVKECWTPESTKKGAGDEPTEAGLQYAAILGSKKQVTARKDSIYKVPIVLPWGLQRHISPEDVPWKLKAQHFDAESIISSTSTNSSLVQASSGKSPKSGLPLRRACCIFLAGVVTGALVVIFAFLIAARVKKDAGNSAYRNKMPTPAGLVNQNGLAGNTTTGRVVTTMHPMSVTGQQPANTRTTAGMTGQEDAFTSIPIPAPTILNDTTRTAPERKQHISTARTVSTAPTRDDSKNSYEWQRTTDGYAGNWKHLQPTTTEATVNTGYDEGTFSSTTVPSMKSSSVMDEAAPDSPTASTKTNIDNTNSIKYPSHNNEDEGTTPTYPTGSDTPLGSQFEPSTEQMAVVSTPASDHSEVSSPDQSSSGFKGDISVEGGTASTASSEYDVASTARASAESIDTSTSSSDTVSGHNDSSMATHSHSDSVTVVPPNTDSTDSPTGQSEQVSTDPVQSKSSDPVLANADYADAAMAASTGPAQSEYITTTAPAQFGSATTASVTSESTSTAPPESESGNTAQSTSDSADHTSGKREPTTTPPKQTELASLAPADFDSEKYTGTQSEYGRMATVEPQSSSSATIGPEPSNNVSDRHEHSKAAADRADFSRNITDPTEDSNTGTDHEEVSDTVTNWPELSSKDTDRAEVSSTVTDRVELSSIVTDRAELSSTDTDRAEVSRTVTNRAEDTSAFTDRAELSSTVTDGVEVSITVTDPPELSNSAADGPELSTTVTDRPEFSSTYSAQAELAGGIWSKTPPAFEDTVPMETETIETGGNTMSTYTKMTTHGIHITESMKLVTRVSESSGVNAESNLETTDAHATTPAHTRTASDEIPESSTLPTAPLPTTQASEESENIVTIQARPAPVNSSSSKDKLGDILQGTAEFGFPSGGISPEDAADYFNTEATALEPITLDSEPLTSETPDSEPSTSEPTTTVAPATERPAIMAPGQSGGRKSARDIPSLPSGEKKTVTSTTKQASGGNNAKRSGGNRPGGGDGYGRAKKKKQKGWFQKLIETIKDYVGKII